MVIHFVERIEITADKQILLTLNHADQFQAILEFLEEYHGQQKNVQPVEKEVG